MSEQSDDMAVPTMMLNLTDVGDGSGDALLELPPQLLAQLGWEINDILDGEVKDDGSLLLTKVASAADQELADLANARLQDGSLPIKVDVEDL